MAKLKVNEKYKTIVELFDSLTGSRSLWEVFNDCIESFALAIQNVYCCGERFPKNEKRYSEIMVRYTEPQQQIIFNIVGEIINLLDANPFQDLLGDLYMRLNFGSDALGQFFTPYNVAKLMAYTNFDTDTIKAQIAEKGYITVNEPTVGGGANIIAFCERLYLEGINYQKHLVIVCQELSRLTALMCYIVLSFLGCNAVIKIGDTLANPFTNYKAEVAKGSELWTTPFFHINNCYRKC